MIEIKIVPGGPYVIDGEDIVLVETSGNQQSVQRPIALCRCGATAAEPLCDGTHRKIGFQCGATRETTT